MEFVSRACQERAARSICAVGISLSSILAPTIVDAETARFQQNDAEEVDREDPDRETESDILSFRKPEHWRRRFSPSNLDYWATAGSLNIKRFYFEENLGIDIAPENDWLFGLTRYRYQDLAEERAKTEALLGRRAWGPIFLGILGFSDSFKERGDLGGFAEWRESRQKYLRAYYVSIDHYFNEKKSSQDETYKRLVWESGVKGLWTYTDGAIAGAYAYSSPVRWQRNKYQYVYEQNRRQAELDWEHDISDDWRIDSSVFYDGKRESKQWSSGAGKSMTRQVIRARLGFVAESSERDYWSFGTAPVWRDADYEQEPAGEEYLEEFSPDQERIDGLFYINRQWSNGLRAGVIAGGVWVMQGSRDFSEEVKPSLSWEQPVGKYGVFMINTTYDLDETIGQFPYRKGFPGWDGGNLQVRAEF